MGKGKVVLLILVMSFCVPHTFAEQEERKDRYDINSYDPKLIKQVQGRVAASTKRGNEKKVEMWSAILDALYGDNVLQAMAIAAQNMQFAKKKKIWSRIFNALYTVQALQLIEYDEYDFDPDLIEVMKNRMASAKGVEAEVWRGVLMMLSGQSRDDVVNSISALKQVISLQGNEPPEWDQLIGALENYALESYGEKALTAEVRSNSAYEYDIYDTETGDKIGSIDASPIPGIGSLGSQIDGFYNTNTGRTKWALYKLGNEDTNYLSYGWWAHSFVPVGRENDNFNERPILAFFHGDNPAQDVSNVRGAAIYTGSTAGVWKYNTPGEHGTNGFKGNINLLANFETDTISGQIINLTHSINYNNPSDSVLPTRIYLGTAEFSSNGQFSGQTSFDHNNKNGEWNGRFYNHDSPEDAPGEVGGAYSITTGIQADDMQIEGSFGASQHIHIKSYRPASQ
ncbi:MAG: hypothetical protein OXM55_01805 [Bdellovibrionales bacterium]|nr:hypothetical protein [Bdellovibrionales bacterium]